MQDKLARRPRWLMLTALGGLGALLSLAIFAGWILQGPDMILTMAQNGLSWCF